jgi:two-component system chemotaxis response regulator CheY
VSCTDEEADVRTAVRSCLVIDDSRVVQKVARRILEGLSFVVDAAVDGELALVACRQRMPTAILLDWNMPVMNGIDFLRSLRGMDGGDAPVVVFCTTMSDIRYIQEALGAGANDYIIKPFDADILREKFTQLGLL